jgi:PadR family transcriptional regulator, regulatory protein PadR
MEELRVSSRDSIGEFEQLAMLAVWRLGQNAYGTTIKEEIEIGAERGVAIGALYTTLDRLERKGFVTSEVGEATPERGGRAKRFFRLTGSGESALRKSLKGIRRLTVGFLAPEEVL